MGNEITDPILLTSVCKFTRDLLENNVIKNSSDKMEPYHIRMKNLKMMIPYLGFEKYPLLLEMTRRYHKAENPEPKMTNSGHEEEAMLTHIQQEKNDDTLDEDGDEQAQKILIEASLQHLDDQIAC